MAVVVWIVIGAFFGSIARFVMPGPRAGGIPVGIAVGIGGAVATGLAAAWLTGGGAASGDGRSYLAALNGALYALLAYRAFALKRPAAAADSPHR